MCPWRNGRRTPPMSSPKAYQEGILARTRNRRCSRKIYRRKVRSGQFLSQSHTKTPLREVAAKAMPAVLMETSERKAGEAMPGAVAVMEEGEATGSAYRCPSPRPPYSSSSPWYTWRSCR